MYAAITGDIIGSARLKPEQRDEVYSVLKKDFNALNELNQMQFPFEFLRGDSFQGVTSNISESLNLALQLKCIFRKNFTKNKIRGVQSKHRTSEPERKNWRIYNNLDVRLSIGLGEIEYLKDDQSVSDGEAFKFSGRALEEMKSKGQKFLIISNSMELNRELEVELKLLDAIIDKWTPMSAEVVFHLLFDKTENEISEILKVSQSAINQRKKTAGWDAIEVLLKNYKHLMGKILKP